MQMRDQSLWSLTVARSAEGRRLSDDRSAIRIADLKDGSCFNIDVKSMRGCSVLILTATQLTAALAAIELDGIAERILLCTPEILPHVASILTTANVDTIVSDDSAAFDGIVATVKCRSELFPLDNTTLVRNVDTAWVLFTSGTTGQPKMVVHTLASLTGPLGNPPSDAGETVWSTFYDIRRYGGLQILLRALIGGGSMVLSNSSEAVGDFLTRLAAAGVTHLSGTPSHWRRALMSPAASAITPQYVRLSGETADQAILDRLHAAYPTATVAHAFASTEAGVAFDVRDGLAGFPATYLTGRSDAGVEMRIEDGTLRIRSARGALQYMDQPLRATEGFIDTGDVVEQRGNRCYFMGRREGVINVGGQKVYPEEIENIITRHPDVLMAKVWPRKSPILGAIVAADVMLRTPVPDARFEAISQALRSACQQSLPAYKIPATWRQVETIELSTSGKVQRTP